MMLVSKLSRNDSW